MELRKCLPVLALLAFPHAVSIADVPAGELLWIQGYDGNPPMAGFLVTGTLRIEAVDDSQPAGINLSSGTLINSPLGLIVVNHGAGGGRFINGSVLNQGEFRANTAIAFAGDDAVFKNTGVFTSVEGAKADFRGRNGRLELSTGQFTAVGGVEMRDGTIAYDGGEFSGDLALFRSRMRVAPQVTNAFDVNFSGINCRFEGAITPDRMVTAWGGDEGSAATLELAGDRISRGTVVLSSRGGGFDSWLTLPPGGWTNAPGGRFQTLQGSGGFRRVVGDLRNEGEWQCSAGVIFSAQSGPPINVGTVNLTFSGVINSPRGYRQIAGSTTLVGGGIYSPTNEVVIAGGTLEGGGRVYGHLINEAQIIQKQWQGPLRVDGVYEQTESGRLTLTLNTSGGTNAILQITNTAKLAGLLEISHVNTAIVRPGDRFLLLRAAGLDGWFGDIRLPALRTGLHWHVERDEREVSITAAEQPKPLTTDFSRFLSDGIFEVTGGISRRLRVEFSEDLAGWTLIADRTPFPAYLQIDGLVPSSSSRTAFFRTTLER